MTVATTPQEIALLGEIRDALVSLNHKLSNIPASQNVPSSQHPVVFSLPYPTEAIQFWQVTVPVTQTQIIRYNDQRISLLIFNIGLATIFIHKTKQVSLTMGFPIPGGAAISFDNYIGDVWAISTAPVLVGIIEMEAR